jgi:hypothetical protein
MVAVGCGDGEGDGVGVAAEGVGVDEQADMTSKAQPAIRYFTGIAS